MLNYKYFYYFSHFHFNKWIDFLCHINNSCPEGLSASVVTLQQKVTEAGKNLHQNAIFKGCNDIYCRGRIFKFTVQKLIPCRNERPEDLEPYHIGCHFFNPLGSSFPQQTLVSCDHKTPDFQEGNILKNSKRKKINGVHQKITVGGFLVP